MPKKTTAKNKATPRKADFIRSHSSLPAKEIVEEAKAARIMLTLAHIYAVQSKDRKNASKAKNGLKRKPGRPAGSKNKTHKTASNADGTANGHAIANDTAETTFRRMVVELGIGRAKALVSEVETKLVALVRGL